MSQSTSTRASPNSFSFFQELGGVILFQLKVIRTLLTTRENLKPIAAQIVYVFTRSLSTVAFAGIFAGAIIVLQFNLMLKRFDAQVLLGGLNTSALLREIGPLIISFLLAGKIGAFTAAELGTMRVTEQIDALECLGADPIQYLIVPRFTAIIFSSVLLLIFGLMISLGGSMAVARLACGLNPEQFASTIPRFNDAWTLASGFFKCAVYGTIVASVACYKGFTASGGARGVGRAVTLTAVYINFYIVIANFITSHIIEDLRELTEVITGGFGG